MKKENMRTDLKTQRQQRAYFLYLEWIAEEMTTQGITLWKLVQEIDCKVTKNTLHEINKTILEKQYHKTSTTGITREELSWTLDTLDEALAKLNVVIPFPEESKRQLLSFYD